MSFTGNESHTITLTAAAALTENFRTSNPGASTIKGFYYSQSAIQDILDQTDCVGIRVYYGEDINGEPKLVIVGVKANEDDLDSGYIAEYGVPCPTRCGSNNSLNS